MTLQKRFPPLKTVSVPKLFAAFSILCGLALPSISVAQMSPPHKVVDDFNAAIVAQDRATVERSLDPAVQIFEAGYVERSRDEYLGHHFLEDAKFAKGLKTRILKRGETQSGDVAVVWTETATEGSYEGKPVKLLGTETMVLKQVDGQWRIVHLHWSSRKPK
jgi:ketosteroid isomerase-like protein